MIVLDYVMCTVLASVVLVFVVGQLSEWWHNWNRK